MELASRNVEMLLDMNESGDATARSWFEFKHYEIVSRDYILGYDFGSTTKDTAREIREAVEQNSQEKMLAEANRRYEADQCERFR